MPRTSENTPTTLGLGTPDERKRVLQDATESLYGALAEIARLPLAGKLKLIPDQRTRMLRQNHPKAGPPENDQKKRADMLRPELGGFLSFLAQLLPGIAAPLIGRLEPQQMPDKGVVGVQVGPQVGPPIFCTICLEEQSPMAVRRLSKLLQVNRVPVLGGKVQCMSTHACQPIVEVGFMPRIRSGASGGRLQLSNHQTGRRQIKIEHQ